MLQRLPWCMLLVLLGGGCASGPERAIKPRRVRAVSTPEIYLTGRVLHDASGQEQFEPLMQAIPANSPCSYEHEATLHIHHIEGLVDHDYYVLVGPDYEAGTGMDFQVTTSTATVNLTIGWAILVGQLPVSETDLVSTSPSGTLLAERVVQGPHRQTYVYNLEPTTSSKVVKVTIKSNKKTVDLCPQRYIIVEQNSTSDVQPISPDDRFVAHMRARAAVAKFDTAR
jgi:hypothetical protein